MLKVIYDKCLLFSKKQKIKPKITEPFTYVYIHGLQISLYLESFRVTLGKIEGSAWPWSNQHCYNCSFYLWGQHVEIGAIFTDVKLGGVLEVILFSPSYSCSLGETSRFVVGNSNCEKCYELKIWFFLTPLFIFCSVLDITQDKLFLPHDNFQVFKDSCYIFSLLFLRPHVLLMKKFGWLSSSWKNIRQLGPEGLNHW